MTKCVKCVMAHPIGAIFIVLIVSGCGWLLYGYVRSSTGHSALVNNTDALNALVVSLGRSGIGAGAEDLKREIRNDRIASLSDLRDCVERHGVQGVERVIRWAELVKSNGPVILELAGQTFGVVDTREGDGLHAGEVRLYRLAEAAKWIGQTELEAIWKGGCIVTFGPNRGNGQRKPQMKWETTFQDIGFVSDVEEAAYRYNVRNVGDKPLDMQVAQLGCGCTTAEIAPKRILPGEMGTLVVKVDPSKKRGYYLTSLKVVSNDAEQVISTIYAAGYVMTSITASVDAVYIGNMHRGNDYAQEIYLHDPGDLSLDVRRARLEYGTDKVTSQIVASVTSKRLKESEIPPAARSKFSILAGDYQISLALKVGPRAPFGTYEGNLLIDTERHGEAKQFKVLVRGTIVSDVYAQPGAVLLSSKTTKASVELINRLGNEVRVGGAARIIGNIDVNVRELRAGVKGHKSYEVMLKGQSRSESRNGTLVFSVSDGSSVEVPVVIFGAKDGVPSGTSNDSSRYLKTGADVIYKK